LPRALAMLADYFVECATWHFRVLQNNWLRNFHVKCEIKSAATALNLLRDVENIGTEVPVFGYGRYADLFLRFFVLALCPWPFQNPDYREIRIAA